MRALVTALVSGLVILTVPAPASAQDEQVTIGVEPAGPVEVAGGATAEFTVLVRKHAQERIEFGLLVEKRGLEMTVEGCREQTDEHVLCILGAESTRTLKLTVVAPEGAPEHDEYHSVHAWVHEVDPATRRVDEQAVDVAVATVVVPGKSPFRPPAPRPDDSGFVPVVRGRVIDSVTGDPVRNACLLLESEYTYPDQVCTGDDGRYRFVQHGGGPLPAGGLDLEVNASGYQDYSESLRGVTDHALVHTVRLVSKTPPAAPDVSGPPVVLLLGIAGGAGLALVVLGVVLAVVRGRSARARLDPLAAVPAVLGQDVHVGSTAAAVPEAAGHEVVTTVAAGEQGPKTSALRVGEAVSTHGRIHSDDEDQIKPTP